MNVSKNDAKSRIDIVKKIMLSSHQVCLMVTIYKWIDFNKTDPKFKWFKRTTRHYTVTEYIQHQIEIVPQNVDYYINGKKVSPLEAEALSPNDINSVDVQKNVGGKIDKYY
jgi:hypothetical protein